MGLHEYVWKRDETSSARLFAEGFHNYEGYLISSPTAMTFAQESESVRLSLIRRALNRGQCPTSRRVYGPPTMRPCAIDSEP